MSEHILDVEGITLLAEGLVRNSSVIDLIIKGNPFGARGGSRFFDVMQLRQVKL